MALTLSAIEFDQLWQESHLDPNGSEVLLQSAHLLCRGYRQLIDLRTSLYLFIQDYEFAEELLVEEPPDQLWPEFAFHLLGNRKLANGQGMRPGQNFLAVGPDPGGRVQWPAHQRNLKVDIHIDAQALSTFIEGQAAQLPLALKQLAQGADDQPYFGFGSITPAMQIALSQILNCPYQGLTRQIYLESKCLELIALRLEQVVGQQPNFDQFPCLKEADIKRVYQAQEVLMARLDRPPSLMALAQEVGLNDYKLKLGFRQVFGTTVFGYLHRYRMEKAQQLLMQPQLTIAGVAQAVGYTSQSRFCDAFKRRYGLTPRSYRAGMQL